MVCKSTITNPLEDDDDDPEYAMNELTQNSQLL